MWKDESHGKRVDVRKTDAEISIGYPALAGLRVHDLRHTAASLAISCRANMKIVQRMLGHKTASITLD